MSAASVPDEAASTKLLRKQSLWWPLHIPILYFLPLIKSIRYRANQFDWSDSTAISFIVLQFYVIANINGISFNKIMCLWQAQQKDCSHVQSVFSFRPNCNNKFILTAITNVTNKMQLCRIIYCFLTALHVSNDIFAHDREHLNCNYSFWFYSRLSLSAAADNDIRE